MKQQKSVPRKVLRMRQLRRDREMTQSELARRVHLTVSAIHSIESGRSKPSIDTAMNLAQVFGVPVEELFSYVEVPA